MKKCLEPNEEIDALGKQIVDAAFCVHKNLGPGLLESIYEECLCYELSKRNIPFERQKSIPIEYDGIKLKTDPGLKLDVFVDKKIVVEIKAAEAHKTLFEAQLLTYMKLTNTQIGFLINFNVSLFKNGIKRLINSN